MRARNFTLGWVVIVGLFVAWGFYTGGTIVPGDGFYWASAREDGVSYGALGVGVATSLVVGIFAVTHVRSRVLSRALGVLLVAASSVVAAVLPPFIMMSSGLYTSGDAGMALPFVAVLTFIGATVAFVILTLCVLLVPRTQEGTSISK